MEGIDTTRADSALRTPHYAPQESDLDTVVTYSADRVTFTFEPRVTHLRGNAKIAYRDMTLEADQIDILWSDDMLVARGTRSEERGARDENGNAEVAPDSSLVPRSSSLPSDSIVWKGLPKLKDGEQTITGDEMFYNIKTRRGRVLTGVTQYGDGFTHGKVIKKVDEDVLNIASGYYTTCDTDPPHYYFWSRDLKLVVKNKVIARPVVLCFGPVPVMIVPFGTFPARGGRHSGMIIPTYGESAAQGRYFRNLGYYFAPNDYMDAKGSLDFYERYGILFRADAQYVKRYRFNGNLSGSFNNRRLENERRGYDLVFNHRQVLSPSANLNVRGQYVSSREYRQDLSLNPYERMQQTLRSDATLEKRWLETPYSGTVNLHYEEDLRSGGNSASMPQVSFSRQQSPLISQPEGATKDDARWFNQIYWGYGLQGVNQRRVDVLTERVTEMVDSLPVSRLIYHPQPATFRSGVRHDISMTYSSSLLEYFTVSPKVSYSEAWFDQWNEYRQTESGEVDTLKHEGFQARRTFNTSMGLNTKLYGLFKPHLFGVTALRHTLSPRLTFSYTPDFGDPKWGIYQPFRDQQGNERYYDRFAGAIYGSPGKGEVMSLGVNLDNLFQYKSIKDEKEQKGELLSLNMGTGYNFAADSLRWSDLTSGVRSTPFKEGLIGGRVSGFNITLNSAHSFYDVVTDQSGVVRRVDRPAENLLRLVSFDLGASFKLSGGKGLAAPDTTIKLPPTDTGDRFGTPVWQPGSVPWSADVAVHYGERKEGFGSGDPSFWSSVGAEVQATRNWRLGYSTRIDLLTGKTVSGAVSIYRDLHCWEGRFTWNPSGVGQGYYLIISIKSSQLRDVKVEKREGGGGYGVY